MSPSLAFGDDRSAGANGCWEWIVRQRWDGWRLEIVTADPPTDFHPVSPEDAELHSWVPDSPRPPVDIGFSEVEYVRAEIDPRVALISRVWNLVAIGPRGDDWLETLRLGSTADWLLREPTSPLVIGRKSGPVNQVLVAADGSSHAQRATNTLATLPWIESVAVRLVVVDDGHLDADSALDQATAALSPSGVELESVVRSGKATNAIIDEIQQTSPDLVVMGARGRNRLQRLVLGSTTAAVAGSCDCSLLVAHAESSG